MWAGLARELGGSISAMKHLVAAALCAALLFAGLLAARQVALDRGLLTAACVAAMFETGHEAANREVFRAEPADTPDLVGLALRGPKKAIDRATRALSLHP